jgi:hypothetical protein
MSGCALVAQSDAPRFTHRMLRSRDRREFPRCASSSGSNSSKSFVRTLLLAWRAMAEISFVPLAEPQEPRPLAFQEPRLESPDSQPRRPFILLNRCFSTRTKAQPRPQPAFRQLGSAPACRHSANRPKTQPAAANRAANSAEVRTASSLGRPVANGSSHPSAAWSIRPAPPADAPREA